MVVVFLRIDCKANVYEFNKTRILNYKPSGIVILMISIPVFFARKFHQSQYR